MKKSPDAGEALRSLFTAGVREWVLLLLGGVLLWAAIALLSRLTTTLAARDATY